MEKLVIKVLGKTALNAGILATGCFNVATASETKTLAKTSEELLKKLRETNARVCTDALDVMRGRLAKSPNIAALKKREDLHGITNTAIDIMEDCLPDTRTLLDLGLVPVRIANAMLVHAGNPERGGSSLFETYAGHRAVFHALCMEGLEAMMYNEGALRTLMTPHFESLLKIVHRNQTQLDRIISAVHMVAEETEAPARTLEAAYRAHVLRSRGEDAPEEDLEERLRTIAGDYALWKQLIMGIDAREPGAAAMRAEALTFLEAGQFDKAQARFKAARVKASGTEGE